MDAERAIHNALIAKRNKELVSEERKLHPGVTMSTKLPDGSMITETYRYKKMERHP
jgi:hypothetical protein